MGSKSTNNNKPNITKTDGHLIEYFSDTFSRGSHAGQPTVTESQGIDATGGFISVYEDPTTSGVYYKSHTFTGSGTFTVNSLNDGSNQIEYVVVGGGGGGGGYNVSSPNPSYWVGNKGTASNFDDGGPNPIQSAGGGGGGVYSRPISASGNTGDFGPIAPGGSGGGGAGQPPNLDDDGGTGTANQGYNGGRGYYDPTNMWRGAGGGGAGGVGENGGPQSTTGWSLPANNGVGGNGVYTRIINGGLTGLAGGGSAGGRSAAEGAGLENDRLPGGTFGGGYGGSNIRGGDASAHSGSGGGGGDSGGAGSGGGGAGGYRSSVVGESSGGGGSAESKFTVAANTSYNIIIGSGGSGTLGYNSPSTHLQPRNSASVPGDYAGGGGNGASGVVVVRYPVPSLTSNNSYKASGGQVYQWVAPNASAIGDGTQSITVHVFTETGGSFVTPGTFNETIEYLIIGGGGGGGVGGSAEGSGGGGAGGFLTGTLPVVGSQNFTINVGGGGLGGTPTVKATNGGYSAVGSALTAWGGGRGGSGFDQTDSAGSPGGSGGGQGYSPNPGVVTAPLDTNQGNPGGLYDPSTYMGGGGGGAGGAGGNNGHGGTAKQFPVTFQNPNAMEFAKGYPGPGGTDFWVCGGGGGGAYNQTYTSELGRGGGPGGPFGGAGDGGLSGGTTLHVSNCTPGRRYSGSGGGGSSYNVPGMTGGSGIVLIAYPS
tara:strand:+ start:423 stop:2540 length:2118 start_codon:yes stop_codon:yes gene_type:complete